MFGGHGLWVLETPPRAVNGRGSRAVNGRDDGARVGRQLGERLHDLVGHVRVETRRGLVEKEDRRPVDERERDCARGGV
eukprot:635650-Prymnesium_polylepis.1